MIMDLLEKQINSDLYGWVTKRFKDNTTNHIERKWIITHYYYSILGQ